MSDDDKDDPYSHYEAKDSDSKKKRPYLARVPEGDHAPNEIDRFLAGRATNDIGNAERLVARYGDQLMWVPESGWHIWDGVCWSLDGDGDRALAFAQRMVKEIWREVAALREKTNSDKPGDAADRTRFLINWATTSGNTPRLKAALEAAQPMLRVEMDALDADPYTLYTPNEALQIHPSEKAIPRDRAHRVTKLTRAKY